MAGTEQPLAVFLKLDKTSEMGADPRQGHKPLIRPVDDDTGSIVKDKFLRISRGNILCTEDNLFFVGLFDLW